MGSTHYIQVAHRSKHEPFGEKVLEHLANIPSSQDALVGKKEAHSVNFGPLFEDLPVDMVVVYPSNVQLSKGTLIGRE